MLGSGYLIGAGGGSALQSIQFGTISMTTGQAFNTAAISAVVLANSVVIPLGATWGAVGDVWDTMGIKLALTSTTQVTASRFTQDGTGTPTVSFVVLEFAAGVVKSNQDFDVTMNAVNTNTATISAVTVAKSVIIPRGWTYDSALADGISSAGTTLIRTLGNLTLTNTTTVTAVRGDATKKLILSGTVLEFN